MVNSMNPSIEINHRKIGRGNPAYIIAEMSANHRHHFDTAVEIIEAAKAAGADAVKLQTYTPDTLTIDCGRDCFRVKGTAWEGRSLYQLYQEAYTPWEWQPRLKAAADAIGIDLFSTPFDDTAVDFLEGMNVPAYKIASFEIVDLPLLGKIGRTGKPVILSTGMATLAEIGEAVGVLRKAGNTQLALLKCTSAYPAPPEEMNLRTIPHMVETFGVPTGLSDHTLGIEAPAAAVALGACIVEKHFTLSRESSGPDSGFSLEPGEFGEMVETLRVTEKALGEVAYGTGGCETNSRMFRRSLFVVEDLQPGDPFTGKNVRSIRPGVGLHTRHMVEVMGQHASREIKRGTPLAWHLVE